MTTEAKSMTKREREIIEHLKNGSKIYFWSPGESSNNRWGCCIEHADGKQEPVRLSFMQNMWVKRLVDRTDNCEYKLFKDQL